MKLPALRTLKTNPHGFAEVPFEQEEEDQEPNFDIPQSREEKPAAYPNGPICIYESGVYLYFEPTAAQATEFDVIVNVASEVKNPFTSPAPDSQKDLDARRIDGPPAENVDFASLPERAKTTSFDTQSSSPTTPKATPILEPLPPREQVVNGAHTKTPEYIHMPWEHNTDIVPDLYKLVKMMDDRVKQGKRVLVHCQCGVSRSASLIVAYGLYKNPGISVQEAYDAVKKRSKWIGPNMNLIMQLQEFRNGLLRANESRAHNQGFSSARRFAGLPTSVSTGTTRPSPFDREAPTGSRTPRTAPLPPETDMNMQRASTGNMISISPGPLSAPSGSLFSSEFRRSWAPGQTDFDLSPKSSPGPLPYADPKRQVVPLLSVTDDNGLGQRTARSDSGFDVPSRGELAIPPVPNFSRQLPFRRNADSENTVASAPAAGDTESTLSVPAPPAGLEPLRSPVAPTFNIAPVVPVEKREGARHLPPKPMQFNSSTWNPVSEVRNQPRENHDDYVDPLSSPISSEFRLAGLKREETENHYELLSPTATSFNLEPGPGQQSTSANFESDDFEVSSPTISEFPKNPFARIDDSVDSGVTSPRASEFHMTPLKPSIADEDPFGLTSPTRFEFPGSCHGQQPLLTLLDPEPRRPSFQAIHPPSNLAQPEATGGFASLNGTARPQPPVVSVDISSPASSEEHPGSNPQEEPQPEPDTPKADRGAPIVPSIPIPKIPDTSFSTPLKPIGIRTRFSSPNMREQRKLHKLQTEIEAMLPGRASQPTQSVDDLDALMSPRAEEFTRNPFHFEVQSPVDDTSPASSTETIRDDQGRTEWKEISQLTPQKVVADPRSPVQAGSSPIVRNIWDVL
jgi:tyrosine-protein phosphatase